MPLVLRVDGQPVPGLVLRPSATVGQKRAEVAYDPVQHSYLLGAMSAGEVLEFALFSDELGYSPMPLQGAKAALDHALAVCQGGAGMAQAAQGDGPLSAGNMRAQLIGKPLWWGDDAGTFYFPDGRYEGTLGGRANNGSYEITTDGRLCWSRGVIGGCFRFYREGGKLMVRRDDDQSQSVLGELAVQEGS